MQVVNKRHHKPTDRDVYVGRPSPLGNPYSVGDYTREDAIRLYELWLLDRLAKKDSPRVMSAWEALADDSILVCWCLPLPCHAQVILRVWEQERQADRAGRKR